MSNLQKTHDYLQTIVPGKDTDPEWFLAMWYTQFMYEFTWKERARTIQSWIKCPISYEEIQDEFFEQLDDEYEKPVIDEFIADFYGGWRT